MTARYAVSGMTLIEMAAVLAISGVILGGSMAVLRQLQRLADADTAKGTRVECACDQLRRDLAHGAVEVLPDGLQIQAGDQQLRWRLIEGHLERDGRQMLAADRFDVQLHPPLVIVTIAPAGLPVRRIEALP